MIEKPSSGRTNHFYLDILAQPQALRELIEFYSHPDGARLLAGIPRPELPILTGMGASYHASWITAEHLHGAGIPALLVEATDLLNYGIPLLHRGKHLLYVSQSGASAEVAPILQSLAEDSMLVAVTNDPSSPLASRANVNLPTHAGTETLVATKTYINSLAVLWLLARQWCGRADGNEIGMMKRIADRCEKIVDDAASIVARWRDTFKGAKQILFLGHGPHAATARQAALMVNEWAKVPALGLSAGAFRHGFIESLSESFGAVVFAAPGRTFAPSVALAAELEQYRACVLIVSNGETFELSASLERNVAWDEFLSPLLDVIPAQLFVEALARELGITPGFRYISKVATKL